MTTSKIRIVKTKKVINPLQSDTTYRQSDLSKLCDKFTEISKPLEFSGLVVDAMAGNFSFENVRRTLLATIDDEIKARMKYDSLIFDVNKVINESNNLVALSGSQKNTNIHYSVVKKLKKIIKQKGKSIQDYKETAHLRLANIKHIIMNFYNNYHLMFNALYCIEHNLVVNQHKSMSELISFLNLDYKDRTILHDFNKLRNTLIHSNILYTLRDKDLLILKDSIFEVMTVTHKITNEHTDVLNGWLSEIYDIVSDKAYTYTNSSPMEKKVYEFLKLHN